MATNWQPAAVAMPWTLATTGWGRVCIVVMSSVQVWSRRRTSPRPAPTMSAKS